MVAEESSYFGISNSALEEALFKEAAIKNRVSPPEANLVGPLFGTARMQHRAYELLRTMSEKERDRTFVITNFSNPLQKIERHSRKYGHAGVREGLLDQAAEALSKRQSLVEVESVITYLAGEIEDPRFFKEQKLAAFSKGEGSWTSFREIVPGAQELYIAPLSQHANEFRNLEQGDRKLILFRELFYNGKWDEMRRDAMNQYARHGAFYSFRGKAIDDQIQRMDTLSKYERSGNINFRWFANLPHDISIAIDKLYASPT